MAPITNAARWKRIHAAVSSGVDWRDITERFGWKNTKTARSAYCRWKREQQWKRNQVDVTSPS